MSLGDLGFHQWRGYRFVRAVNMRLAASNPNLVLRLSRKVTGNHEAPYPFAMTSAPRIRSP